MSDFDESALASLVYESRPITYGIVQPGPDISPDGIPLIRGKDYSSGKVSTEGLYHVLPAIDQPYSRSKVLGGDLLFSIVGYVGLTAQVPAELTGANITQTTARLSIDPNKAESTYVFHFLSSPHYRPNITRYEKGSAQPGLNLSDVQKLKIKHPKLAQQRRIATILTILDEVIEATEKLVEKHQQIKAGLMHDLFTRGLWTRPELARGDHKGTPAEATAQEGQLRPTPEEAPGLYQDSPIGLIPRSWETKFLGDLVQFDSGYAFKNQELSETGIKVVRITNLHRPTFPYWHYDGRYPETWIVDDGDLLFSWAGVASSIDCYIYRGDRALLNQHIYNFRTKDELMKPYLFEFLQWILPKLRESIEGGAGQLHLTKGKIQGIEVLMPPTTERQEILERLQAHQRLLQTQTTHLAKLRQQKQGLMHDLLTGRVRVDAACDA
jgi:type I restriction enzyme S subunit